MPTYGTGAPGTAAISTNQFVALRPTPSQIQQVLEGITRPAADLYESVILADGPSVFWRLNDPAGSANVVDSSGNAVTGYVAGSTALGVSGPVGTAVDFNGGQIEAIAGQVASSFTFTIECAFNLDSLGGGVVQTLASLRGAGGGADDSFQLRNDADNNMHLVMWNTGHTASNPNIGITPYITAGTWYHLVVTVQAPGSWIAYLNGVQKATGATPNSISASVVTTAFSIGNNNAALIAAGGNEPAIGMLDEVAYYPYVLTSTQIAQHYAAYTGATPAGGTASITLSAAGSGAAASAGTASLDLSATGAATAASAGTASLSLSAAGGAQATAAGTASISLGVTGARYATEVLADSPLFYLRGGISGGSALDSSGNGRDFTLSGTTQVPGLLVGDSDPALDFNSPDGASLNDAAWMDVSSITVETLVNLDSIAAQTAFVTRDQSDSGTDRAWGFRSGSAAGADPGKVQFYFFDSAGVLRGVYMSTGTLSANTTTHVAATYDGSKVRLYINGLVDSTASASWGTIRNVTQGIQIGRRKVSATPTFDGYMDGRLDEVAVYDHALSDARILAHYNAAVGNIAATAATAGTASVSLSATGAARGASAGTASLSLSATGTAIDIEPASGTASLSLSASGTGGATSAGTASLSLSAAGSAKASATGTASVSLSATGAASSALSAGAATLSLSGSGGATAGGSGSASLTLSGSGAAKAASSGTAAIGLFASGGGAASSSGTASVSLSATGTATGASPASGTASVSLSASGGATTNATGTASLALSATGAASVAAPAGTAAVTLAASGAGAGRAAGTAAVSLSATGAGRGVGAGTASLSLAASGTAGASAAGSASLTLTATGTTTASATGTASVSLSAAGTAAARATAGAASISLSAAGTARAATSGAASITLSASGAVVATPSGTAALTVSASGGAASAGAAGSAVLNLVAVGTGKAALSSGLAHLDLLAAGSAAVAAAGFAYLELSATGFVGFLPTYRDWTASIRPYWYEASIRPSPVATIRPYSSQAIIRPEDGEPSVHPTLARATIDA